MEADSIAPRISSEVRSILRNSVFPTALIRLDGRWLLIAESFCRFFGYPESELMHIGLQDLIHRDDRESFMRLGGFLASEEIGGTAQFQKEVRCLHKSGCPIRAHLTFSLIRGEADDPLYVYLQVQENDAQLVTKLQEVQLELQNTVEQQQGMTFKFKLVNGSFVHTMCAGQLAHRLGFCPAHVIGKTLHDMYPKEKADYRETFFRRAWNGEEDVVYEGTSPQGITYLVSMKPVRNYGGGIVEVIASCVDITDRKQAEENLRDAETLYRSLVENALIGVYFLQHEKLVYTNPYFYQMFGYDREEILDIDPACLTTEEDINRLSEIFRNAISDTNVGFHYTTGALKKDGSTLNLEGSSTTIYYKGAPAIIGTIQDITYKKQAETSLRDSASGYQRLIKFLPEPIVVSDSGGILYANVSAVKLLKADEQEVLIGTSIYEFIHPDDHTEAKRIIQQVMKTDDPTDFIDCKVICRDGRTIEAEISSIGIHNYMGRPVLLSVLRDMTDRKRAEELLIRSEKLSVVGQLAAGVAHEIRNPLTSLRGFTQLLKNQLGGRFSFMDIMLSELDRINYIVNEFMTLAKPHLVHFRSRHLPDILNGVISILEPQALLMKVNLLLDIDELHVPISCDENQLKQVFVNVIKNAIEAMPDGGTIRIIVRLTHSDHVLVRIKDEGPGIPEEHIRKIGEPFYTTKEHGTGLGLMICQRIIEAHRGTFRITSKKGEGTTVDILLPV